MQHNCKLSNRKSDILQALQSSQRYLFSGTVDDDITFIMYCWHIFGVVYLLWTYQTHVGDAY